MKILLGYNLAGKRQPEYRAKRAPARSPSSEQREDTGQWDRTLTSLWTHYHRKLEKRGPTRQDQGTLGTKTLSPILPPKQD